VARSIGVKEVAGPDPTDFPATRPYPSTRDQGRSAERGLGPGRDGGGPLQLRESSEENSRGTARRIGAWIGRRGCRARSRCYYYQTLPIDQGVKGARPGVDGGKEGKRAVRFGDASGAFPLAPMAASYRALRTART
jgi:hypothetical protein